MTMLLLSCEPLGLVLLHSLVILPLRVIATFTRLAKAATSPLLEGEKVKPMAILSETGRH